MEPLENKEIRGISLKLIWFLAGMLLAFAAGYWDIKSTTLENRRVTNSFKDEWKDQQRMNDLRMREMETNQRMNEIRLTVIETQMNMKK